MRIVIIMPTYNESENIGEMIDALRKRYFVKNKKLEIFLLVVDDNSPDGTADIVKQKMQQCPQIYLLCGKKKGLGYAYVKGMKFAMKELNADAVIEMDADFQHDPSYVEKIVMEFINGADYVIGSRYIEGGSVPIGWAFYRRAISRYGNLFAKYVLGLHNVSDLTTGFRLTRVKGVLEKIDLDNLMELHRFAFKVDLMYKTLFLSKKTIEVPIHFLERVKEKSKFNLVELIATYKVVVLLRLNQLLRK